MDQLNQEISSTQEYINNGIRKKEETTVDGTKGRRIMPNIRDQKLTTNGPKILPNINPLQVKKNNLKIVGNVGNMIMPVKVIILIN